MTDVRMFDLQRSLVGVEDEILDAVRRVIRSGTVILGPEGHQFEQEFADYTGARSAVGVATGTDALILALRACEVQAGDEVITVANTAVPTASAIRAIGAVPVFVDVQDDTLLIDPTAVTSAVTSRTKAIIPVHLHGLPVPLEPLTDIARKHHLRIIEDCAHAHGSRDRGRHTGTRGDIGCFSFYPTKNLGALGDGGMCITSDPGLAARLRALRMYGFNEQRIAVCDGLNSRLDEIQAAVLRVRLRNLDQSVGARNTIAKKYITAFRNSSVRLPAIRPECVHGWHQFVIRVADRSKVVEQLRCCGVMTGIHYEHPLHRMPAFARWVPAFQSLPVTEQAAQEILSVPLLPDLTEAETDRVIHGVLAAVAEYSA